MMRPKLIIAIVTFAIVGGTYIYSQDQAKPKMTTKEIATLKGNVKYEFAKIGSMMIGLMNSKSEKFNENSEMSMQLGPALSEIANDESESLAFTSSNLRTFLRGKSDARSAAQVSQIADEVNVEQNALLVAQNAQIIEQNKKMLAILEKIANKK
jgi:hypothetical protein